MRICRLAAFINYPMYRSAGCLRSNRTGAYCFAEAATNPNPSDVYFYNLPLGVVLPPLTPTCSSCTGALMDIYSNFAMNSTFPLSKSYDSAVSIVDASCGPGYAKQVVVNASSSGKPVFRSLAPIALTVPIIVTHLLTHHL